MVVAPAECYQPSNQIVVAPIDGERYAEIDESGFKSASEEPLSSFSIDADGAAYANVRRMINSNQGVNSNAVRVEEFLNYFPFDLPAAEGAHTLSVSHDISVSPWNSNRYLVRFALKGKEIKEEEMPRSNYVFLVDVSGSMSWEDRIGMVKKGLVMLTENLRDDDMVSIVTYSGDVRLALEATSGKNKKAIIEAINSLNTEGWTNGGQAIKMAYEMAKSQHQEGVNSRVILCTDGDFNFGLTRDDDLMELIKSYLDSGVYLTTLGFGTGNLNDKMMEQLANQGNGTFEYIDKVEQLEKVFVHERSKLHCVAKDTKVQVAFDDEFVNSYRLVGYENRVMTAQEFDDEKKDAGEVGAGQCITALYEIIPTTKGRATFESKSGEAKQVATVTVRYKDSATDKSNEINHVVSSEGATATMSEDQSFAAALAMFAMIVRSSEYSGESTLERVEEMLTREFKNDEHGYRAEFVELVKKYRTQTGK